MKCTMALQGILIVTSLVLTPTVSGAAPSATSQQAPQPAPQQALQPAAPETSTPSQPTSQPPASETPNPSQPAEQLPPQPAAPETSSLPPHEPPPPGRDKQSPYQGKGFLLSSTENGNYSLTLSGRIQVGATFFRGNQDSQLYPNVYSARLIFGGNVLSRKIFYNMQLGYGEQEQTFSPTPLLDAWIDFRHIPEAHVRIGTLDKHAVRHSSANNILTMDSLGHYELDLFRDVGIRIYSDKPFGTDKLKYWFDFTGGKGMTYLDQPSVISLLYYGRVEVSPFGAFDANRLGDLARREHPSLSLAVSGAYNQNAIYQESDFFVAGQMPYQRPFNYVHASADVVFKWHGFSVLGTALYRRATTLSHVVPETGVTEYSRNAWGWFTVAGMMLTDHLEIASRVGALYQIARPAGLVATAPYLAESYIQPNVADFRDLREVAGGASYYIAGHAFKVQADYARNFVGLFREGIHEVRVMLAAQL